MSLKAFLPILLIQFFLFGALQVQTQTPSYEKEIDQLLKKMTLEEKVGQMTQYSGFWDMTGPAPEEGDSKLKFDQLNKGLVGSMLNVTGVENVRKFQEAAVNNSRLGIPLIFGLDVIHGHRTVNPIPLAEAASWDLEAIENSARVGAIEASAVGINWTFAPMVDISRDARWGRVMEGGGEDPFLGSRIAEARVKGFQGDDLSANNTIAACAKHFAAYGFAEAGREYNTVDIGSVVLHNIVMPPFKAAADAGVRTFMNAFNILNGVPATADEYLQREILKGKWNFDGFIISDWASGSQMQQHGFAKDLKHAAKLAANSGSDMDMESYAYPRHLKELVEEGQVKMKVLDDAVRRILRVKFELGLFDDPFKYCNEERQKTLLYHQDHLNLALDIAKKSIVLLKNEDNILPLDTKQKKIAVIGPLANDKNSPLGNWRFGSIDSSAVSVVEGLKALNMDISFSKGPELISSPPEFAQNMQINHDDRSGIEQAIALAKESDLVVLVLGEHGFQSGEARSRTNIDLPGLQQELMEAVYEVNKNIVLVVMSGRPLTINWADENIPAIVQTWQLGSMTGTAIASILTGDYNPSGKLPMSFPRNVGQIPIYYNQYNTGRPISNNDNFWSHYSDVENSPLYPFGYGLSYTQFEYKNLKINRTGNFQIQVMVDVKNVGEIAGEEVIQLYIRDKVGSVVRPIKELKGFEKRMIEAGEEVTVKFLLTEKELGFFNAKGDYMIEKGEFDIMVGPNSRDLIGKNIVLD